MSLTLLDYRRRVAAMYAAARNDGDLAAFRDARHELFTTHPDSPLEPGAAAPEYWPLRPDLRYEADVDTDVKPTPYVTDEARFTRFGTLHLPIGDLDVFWLDGYGGGVFLPFKDATNGATTYGGGRYLLDTVKGADLGTTPTGALVVDFNFAYHPSCSYSPRWTCPLAPPGNALALPVEAGERTATRQ
ncbi:MAG TPA: DUF1684 domain-containing protein [Acidimicrobiales bacterium]|nr:DUF1684 domain-containing protein [Acidimicrobiales bacterium]